jgi:hypothetical protein
VSQADDVALQPNMEQHRFTHSLFTISQQQYWGTGRGASVAWASCGAASAPPPIATTASARRRIRFRMPILRVEVKAARAHSARAQGDLPELAGREFLRVA